MVITHISIACGDLIFVELFGWTIIHYIPSYETLCKAEQDERLLSTVGWTEVKKYE